MLANRTLDGSSQRRSASRTGSAAVVRLTPPRSSLATSVTPPSSASAQLLAVGRKLIADTDRLVEKIVKMIREIPEYRPVKDEALWGEVRQILRANIPVFFNAVIEGRVPKDEEVGAARFFARRRVHQGISLRAHLTAYRNGMWILWEELVNAVMHRPVLQKELLLRAAWAFQHLDIVSSAVSEAYHAEQEGRARHRDRTLRELFDEMIDGSQSSAEELQARAVSVDLDLDVDFHILVFPFASGRAGGSPRTLDLSSVAMVVAQAAGLTVERVVSIERSRELVLLVPRNDEEPRVAVLRSAVAEALEPAIRAGVPLVAGVSGIVRRIPGVRQGYKEAKRAADIGQMLDPTNVVYFYDEYVLQDVLDSGAAAGRRLIGEALGPLLSIGETGQRLMETLRAYFRAGSNLKVAAASLDIHPNTLSYRMRQIHQLTGLDPGNPEQRLRTEIALQLFSMEQKRDELCRAEHATGGRTAAPPPRSKRSGGSRVPAPARA